MTKMLIIVFTVLASAWASAQQPAPKPVVLPDGTTVVVRADYSNVENLPGYDQVKSRAKGVLVALTLEFTAKANPQLNFVIGRQADDSDFSLSIDGTAYPPVAVGGPVDKLDRVRFAGYQYRTDDGRTGYQTFLSGKKELLLLFDVPQAAQAGNRTLSASIRVGGKDATLNVPIK